jgi:hypothetical protein
MLLPNLLLRPLLLPMLLLRPSLLPKRRLSLRRWPWK